MDVKEKMLRISILPITEEFYKKHIEPLVDAGWVDESKYEYYKMYDDVPMLYSYDYLDAHTLKELKKDAKKSHRRFNPTWLSKLMDRFKVWYWLHS